MVLERRIAGGDGVTLPDADMEVVRTAGTIDLARGDWPEAFRVRAGETVFVAVSPFTGCYEFFDTRGDVFWTVVPVFPTTASTPPGASWTRGSCLTRSPRSPRSFLTWVLDLRTMAVV